MSKTLRDELGFEIKECVLPYTNGAAKAKYVMKKAVGGDKFLKAGYATDIEIALWDTLTTSRDENKRLREAIKAFLDDYDNPEDLIPGEGLRFIDQLRKALTDHTKEKQT